MKWLGVMFTQKPTKSNSNVPKKKFPVSQFLLITLYYDNGNNDDNEGDGDGKSD